MFCFWEWQKSSFYTLCNTLSCSDIRRTAQIDIWKIQTTIFTYWSFFRLFFFIFNLLNQALISWSKLFISRQSSIFIGVNRGRLSKFYLWNHFWESHFFICILQTSLKLSLNSIIAQTFYSAWHIMLILILPINFKIFKTIFRFSIVLWANQQVFALLFL